MQHVVADVGLRWKRFCHGLSRCLDRILALPWTSSAMAGRSGAIDAPASNGSNRRGGWSEDRSPARQVREHGSFLFDFRFVRANPAPGHASIAIRPEPLGRAD